MIVPEHIPLAHRKALCARLIFIEASEADRLAVAHSGAKSQLERVRDGLFSITKEAISQSPDSTRLDEFLRELSNSLRSVAPPSWAKREGQDVIDGILSQIEQGLANVSCQTCSPSHVCNGSEKDNVAVDGAGQCISQLRSLFEWANTAAKEAYSNHSTTFESADLPDVTFATSHYHDAPPGVPNDCFVDGATRYILQRTRRISRVELRLTTKDFDRKAYLACLYILFHECMCHVYRFTRPGVEVSEPDSYFSEGWMDWIAYEELVGLLRSRGVAPGSVGFARARLDVAGELHRFRLNPDGDNDSRCATARATGKDAADRLLFQFERVLDSQVDAWKWLRRLSFDLNLSPYSEKELNDFALAIFFNLPSRDQPPKPFQVHAVPFMISKYMKKIDLHELVSDVLNHYSLDK